jgi:hypothetical protein
MKYWLSAALLANIALLLVEFHSGAFESALMEEANGLRREVYSSEHEADAPVARAENSGSELQSSPEAAAEVEPSLPQDDASIADARPLPSSSSLIRTPGQTGIPPLGNEGPEVLGNEPVTSADLPPTAELPPAQSLAAIAEPSKDPIAMRSPAYGAVPGPAPLPVVPAEAQNVSAKKKAETSAAPEKPQTHGTAGPAQRVPAGEQPGKAETSAHSSRAAASAKNKNAGSEAATQEPPPSPPVPNELGKVLTACYMAGPANSIEALNALLRQFRPQLTELAMSPAQAEKTRKRNRFVVYYPAPPSMEASFAAAANLKNTYGIKDLQVIRDGEMKGAIVLGVFSSQRNAESAKSTFEQQGLQVGIKPRFPAENTYKVRMRWTAQQEPVAEQLVDALTQNYPDTQRIGSCE